ncbi:hypothetical protein MKEN_00833700 [Mycena kentingensis (nom. inval.)]|nr:hypothetical protein MKEN_00833700 [Mycena kentingensis (nom. inval.)]
MLFSFKLLALPLLATLGVNAATPLEFDGTATRGFTPAAKLCTCPAGSPGASSALLAAVPSQFTNSLDRCCTTMVHVRYNDKIVTAVFAGFYEGPGIEDIELSDAAFDVLADDAGQTELDVLWGFN